MIYVSNISMCVLCGWEACGNRDPQAGVEEDFIIFNHSEGNGGGALTQDGRAEIGHGSSIHTHETQ